MIRKGTRVQEWKGKRRSGRVVARDAGWGYGPRVYVRWDNCETCKSARCPNFCSIMHPSYLVRES